MCLCVCVCPTCWLAVSWAAFNLSCISFFTLSTSSWAAWATVIWRVTSAFCETHRHVQFSTEPRLLADPVFFPRTWHPLSGVSVVGSEHAAEWERVWWQPLSVVEEHIAKFHLCRKWSRVCRERILVKELNHLQVYWQAWHWSLSQQYIVCTLCLCSMQILHLLSIQKHSIMTAFAKTSMLSEILYPITFHFQCEGNVK